jgi:DNA modification methylase
VWGSDGKRNKRSVWTVTTKPFKGAHFATFPEDLIVPCVLAGCPKDGTVLDPFNGAATTGVVALKNQRRYIGIELNPEYIKLSEERIRQQVPETLTELFT